MSVVSSSMSTVSAALESNAEMVVRFSPSTRVTEAPVAPLRMSLVFTQKETSMYSSFSSVKVSGALSFAVYAAPLVERRRSTFSLPLIVPSGFVKGNPLPPSEARKSFSTTF